MTASVFAQYEIKKIEQAISELSNDKTSDKTFKIVDLLSAEEVTILAGMKIKSGDINRGHFFTKSCDPDRFKSFLQVMENYSEMQEIVSPLLQKLCHNLSNVPNSTMFEIGLLSPENATTYNIIGWHLDVLSACRGEDLLEGKKIYRVLINLKGEGTIFTEVNTEERSKFLDCFCKDRRGSLPGTLDLIETIIPKNDRFQLKPGQAAVFKVDATIHTRPNTFEDRLFMIFNLERK